MPGNNIVEIKNEISANSKLAKKDMLADLDMLRSQIEAGTIKGFAYATAHVDGASANGWSGFNCRSDLSFAISLLTTRYHELCLK